MPVRVAFSRLELLQEVENYVDSHPPLEAAGISYILALGLLTDFVNTVSAKKFPIDRLDVSDV
jgi:hypothetical protein